MLVSLLTQVNVLGGKRHSISLGGDYLKRISSDLCSSNKKKKMLIAYFESKEASTIECSGLDQIQGSKYLPSGVGDRSFEEEEEYNLKATWVNHTLNVQNLLVKAAPGAQIQFVSKNGKGLESDTSWIKICIDVDHKSQFQSTNVLPIARSQPKWGFHIGQ